VRSPDIKPIEKPTASNTASLAEARLRSFRVSRVSRPWIVLACAQRFRPAMVLGPVLRPPCVLHTRLPLRGGAAHWGAVTLKGVYVSKIGLAVRATPTDGPTPTPLGGPLGGSNSAYKWSSLLKKSVCIDVSEIQPRLGVR